MPSPEQQPDNNETPFIGNLEKAQFKDQWNEWRAIKTLTNLPKELQHVTKEKIIRERVLSPDIFANYYRGNMDEALERYKEGQAVFKELQEQYGVPIIETQYVVGKNEENTESIFAIVNRIEGNDITHFSGKGKTPIEARDEIDALFSAMTRYFSDKYNNGGAYWWDFAPRQVLYGAPANTPKSEKHLYIVDIDPAIRECDRGNPLSQMALLSELNSLMQFILRTEQHAFENNESVPLHQARRTLKNVLDALEKKTCPSNHKEIIQDIKTILDADQSYLQQS